MGRYRSAIVFILLLTLVLPGYSCKGQTQVTLTHLAPPFEANDTSIILSNSPYQRIVDAVKALQPSGNYTYYIYYEETTDNFDMNKCFPGEGSFDINECFTVLPNISMEEGYVLDYVFYDYSWGQNPIIYARKENNEPFKGYVEYIAVKNDDTVARSDYDLVTLVKDSENRVHENKIKIDGTKEGFFEYVVLQELGGQFYLSWHSEYNDTRIICDPLRIDDIVKDIRNRNLLEIPAETLEKARNLDFEPVIIFNENTVDVTVIVFTKWGGFKKLTYTISREYPHTIFNVQSEVILGYDCGLAY